MANFEEIWQVDVNGQIYEASFGELEQWIYEGALLPQDRVRRGNLRWLEAGKIPGLIRFFNAKESGAAPQVQAATTFAAPAPDQGANVAQTFENLPNPPQQAKGPAPEPANQAPAPILQVPQDPNSCCVHPGLPSFYSCDSCFNVFCKACPKSYGGSVKICPMCGAMCKPIEEVRQKQAAGSQHAQHMISGFGFSDFGYALSFPLQYKSSLLIGGLMVGIFSVGQSAAGLGSMMLAAGAVFCWMLANMVTFGSMANTIEQMSQGDLESNFMPAFDDFNIWDDILHPFFLSIGAYIVSFGPTIVFLLLGVWFVWNTASSLITQPGAIPPGIFSPGDAASVNSAGQASQIPQIQKQLNAQQAGRNAEFEAIIPPTEEELDAWADKQAGMTAKAEDDYLQYGVDKDLQKLQKARLESMVGPSPETQKQQMMAFAETFVKQALPFLALAMIGLIWGFLYFPAACAVAGYTRSFWTVVNPLVGLDTIRRLGCSYIKILLMYFVVSVLAGIISGILGVVFSPFDMPRLGNIPATFFGGFAAFYFTTVCAAILGLALYKKSGQLNLPRP